MRIKMMVAGLLSMTFAVHVNAESERKISIEEYRDKMEAGWVGQIAGVSWGARTEFRYNGVIIPIDSATGLPEKMGEWSPGRINNAFAQDDLYVEMAFLQTLEKYGLNVTRKQAGIDFAVTRYRLFCGNDLGRKNLRNSIGPPDSGHPQFHSQPHAIDYQIESDYAGLIAPGMPQIGVDMGEVFGRIMNYGDGVYAGQFVAAMYSEAFFETDMRKVVEKGLEAIPAESQYAEVVRDVLDWHKSGMDWQECWKKVKDKYIGIEKWKRKENPELKTPYLEKYQGALDVRVNGAYIVIGLLYGEGDLDKTIIISTRCGNDSDCNPSNAAGILFTSLGMKKIPERFKSALQLNTNFSYTDYNMPKLVDVCTELAKQAVQKQGGKVVNEKGKDTYFLIPQKPVVQSEFVSAGKPGPIANSRFSEAEMEQINTILESQKNEVMEKAQKDLDKFAPGWKVVNSDTDMLPGLKWGNSYFVKPKSKDEPCVFSRTVKVPAGKKTTLSLNVGNQGGDGWDLIVRADMADLLNKTVATKTANERGAWGWMDISVDLSDYAGKTIDLELYIIKGKWNKADARFKKIEIISE